MENVLKNLKHTQSMLTNVKESKMVNIFQR